MKSFDHIKQLENESVVKLILKFSIPAIVGMLVISLYNIVDRIFIGQFISESGIGAVAIIFPLQMFFVGISILFGIGGSTIFSIRLGEKKREEAENIFGNALALLFIPPAILTTLMMIFMDDVLKILGTPDELYTMSRDYLSVILMGVVFGAAGPGLTHFIRADGHPKTAMFTHLLGAVLNIILDPIFILVFDMGIKGAAWATIISQFATFAWVLFYFFSPISKITVKLENLKIKWHLIKPMLSIGFGPFIMQFVTVFLMVTINHQLSKYGNEQYISAVGVVLSIMSIITMPLFGITQGAQAILGYNYGAKRYDRVIATYKVGVIFSIALSTIGFFMILIFPAQLTKIFNSKSSDFINLTVPLLRINGMFLPLVGFQVFSSQFFQSLGKAKKAIFLSMSRQLLLLYPMVYIFPLFFGVLGIVIAVPVSDFLSFCLVFYFIRKEISHFKSLEKSDG